MAIRVECPGCHKKLRAKDSLAGKRVRCPACGHVIEIASMHSNQDGIDDPFLPKLVTGLRRAWQHVRSQRPTETFYLFGIETDSDITDLYPLCNTQEQYAEDKGRAKPSLAKWAMDDDSTLYRAGAKHASALAQEVNRNVFEDHSRDPEGAFEKRKARLLGVFEKALVQLDKEGFFGTGKVRHKVLLTIEFVDASGEEWQQTLEVIKRINPSQSTEEFFALVQQAGESEACARPAKEAVIGMATEFARREKRSFGKCMLASQDTLTPTVREWLGRLLPAKPNHDHVWEVIFEAKGKPEGKMHGKNMLRIVVDAETGNCAICP